MAVVVTFFKSIATHPMETIEFVVPIVLLLSGLWATLYVPFGNTIVGRASDDNPMFAVLLGAGHLALAIPLLYATIAKRWERSLSIRRWLSFVSFLLLAFYGIAGILVNGLERISWISSLGFAVIAAVCHIRLRWDYNA